MSDTDELKQLIRDSQEQSRQQHEETMGRLDKTDKRIAENEKTTQDLAYATRATFQAVNDRIKGLEDRAYGGEQKLSTRTEQKQLATSSEGEAKKSGIDKFASDFLEGFTGGIFTNKK